MSGGITSRKRARALDQAQQICDSGEVDFTFEEVQEWSDEDLYDWLEAWGYTWVEGDGWVDLEDL